jgi:hypothetical protein
MTGKTCEFACKGCLRFLDLLRCRLAESAVQGYRVPLLLVCRKPQSSDRGDLTGRNLETPQESHYSSCLIPLDGIREMPGQAKVRPRLAQELLVLAAVGLVAGTTADEVDDLVCYFTRASDLIFVAVGAGAGTW